EPARALSDGPNALPLARLAPLLETLRDLHEMVVGGVTAPPRSRQRPPTARRRASPGGRRRARSCSRSP
ncbi:MAG: hypothetical protein LC774_14595, partial [Acidobacteria bacterium]|nr:hypothetical protein [Acidobacteriota bacterium]